MLVLLVHGCPVSARAGLRDRLNARLRARRFDHELAAGGSPDATAALALRAQTLVRPRARRDLARAAQRILAAAADPAASGRLPVPVCRDRIRRCSAELEELARRLLSAGPVSPQGVARAQLLLTDAGSPLYHRASADDLRARVVDAVEALDQAT